MTNLKNVTLKYRGENTRKLGRNGEKISVKRENLHRNGEISWKMAKIGGNLRLIGKIRENLRGKIYSGGPVGGENLLFRWKIYIPARFCA